jgi:hypothetical protein
VALIRASHAERSIHVDVMAGQIQGDQTLEENRPAGPGGREENEETGGRAAICHHVQDRAEPGGLLKVPRGISVQGVEEAGDAVQGGAGTGVQRHVVEGGKCEEDARVACRLLDGIHLNVSCED